MNLIRNVLGRLLAAPIAALVGWFGLTQTEGGELSTAVVTAITFAVYGVAHKLFNVKLNPDDKAK